MLTPTWSADMNSHGPSWLAGSLVYRDSIKWNDYADMHAFFITKS